MIVRMVLELDDVPGQLLRALEPIAKFGGNIQSIIHQRTKKTPTGRVPVMLVFEIGDKVRLNRVLEELKSRKIMVREVGEKVYTLRSTVVLIGHVVHADIRLLIDRLNRISGLSVSDLSLLMGEFGKESSARITVAAEDLESLQRALVELEDFCRKKDLLLIKSVEGAG